MKREQMLARRQAIKTIVKHSKTTVALLSVALNVSKATIKRDISASNKIHWQDEYLYYGERL